MRDLTRSVASFTWALSLFGVKQMVNLASPRRAAHAFETVARSTEGMLGPGLRTAFQTGDRLQRAMVDASFSLVGLGPAEDEGLPGETRPSGAPGVLAQVGNLAFEFLQLGVTTVYQASGTVWRQQRGPDGWGPVRQTDRRP